MQKKVFLFVHASVIIVDEIRSEWLCNFFKVKAFYFMLFLVFTLQKTGDTNMSTSGRCSASNSLYLSGIV